MPTGEKSLATRVREMKESSRSQKTLLESNTLLKPAFSLYRKLGFTELKENHPEYERGDIQMELNISRLP